MKTTLHSKSFQFPSKQNHKRTPRTNKKVTPHSMILHAPPFLALLPILPYRTVRQHLPSGKIHNTTNLTSGQSPHLTDETAWSISDQKTDRQTHAACRHQSQPPPTGSGRVAHANIHPYGNISPGQTFGEFIHGNRQPTKTTYLAAKGSRDCYPFSAPNQQVPASTGSSFPTHS